MRNPRWSQFKCHLVLCSCVADVPETEALYSLKRRTQTRFPCNRYLEPRESLSKAIEVYKRSFAMIHKLISEFLPIAEKTDRLKSLSMHCKLPVLVSFSFVGIHTYNEIHSVFRFDPMHNFYLGISKLLHSCL